MSTRRDFVDLRESISRNVYVFLLNRCDRGILPVLFEIRAYVL